MYHALFAVTEPKNTVRTHLTKRRLTIDPIWRIQHWIPKVSCDIVDLALVAVDVITQVVLFI